jgi:SPP1 gp7 family putative phage head morphogenesis protein
MTANEALVDRAIRHSAALTRYGNGLADDVLRFLNSVDEEIVGKLSAALLDIEPGATLTAAARNRLIQVLGEVRVINAAVYLRLGSTLVEQLDALAEAETAFHRDALKASVELDQAFAVAPAARLATIVRDSPINGRILAPWVEALGEGRMAEVEQALRMGLAQSETQAQLVRRIRGTKAQGFNDGVLGVSRRRAQALVRTSVTHVSNMTAQETWRANGDVVKAWQFVATLDTRTSSTCGSKDGQTFPIGEGPIPPLHPNCRSITVAVTRSWRELGLDKDDVPARTRASMDGQVAASTRYDRWLSSQSAERQDEVLGATRGKLFRANKLTLQQMVASDGTRLTLDQLKSKYGDLLS